MAEAQSRYIHLLLEQCWWEAPLGVHGALPTPTMPPQAFLRICDARQYVASAGAVTVFVFHFRRRIFGYAGELVSCLLSLVDRPGVVHIARRFINASGLL